MGSWLYQWEDGSVSFISAPSKEHAMMLLDEVADANLERLVPVHRDGFFVTFKLKDEKAHREDWEWAYEDGAEAIGILLNGRLEEARRRRDIPEEVLRPVGILRNLWVAAGLEGRKIISPEALEERYKKSLGSREKFNREHYLEALAILEKFLGWKKQSLWKLSGVALADMIEQCYLKEESRIYRHGKDAK